MSMVKKVLNIYLEECSFCTQITSHCGYEQKRQFLPKPCCSDTALGVTLEMYQYHLKVHPHCLTERPTQML